MPCRGDSRVLWWHDANDILAKKCNDSTAKGQICPPLCGAEAVIILPRQSGGTQGLRLRAPRTRLAQPPSPNESILSYSVKEMFYTLQGEGAQAGRAAVFCRFAGCNLWSGRESDRASAVCRFCDTDFVGTDGSGGGKFADAAALAARINSQWPIDKARKYVVKYVVFTGGEPLLQLDPALIDAMHAHGFEIAIETNGTLPVPGGVDWICVSPKMGAPLVQTRGSEIKVVIPQTGQDLAQGLASYAGLDFQHFFVQAMDGPDLASNLQTAIAFCKQFPQWRLSLQTHKLLQIP